MLPSLLFRLPPKHKNGTGALVQFGGIYWRYRVTAFVQYTVPENNSLEFSQNENSVRSNCAGRRPAVFILKVFALQKPKAQKWQG
jgi:hypothetical protein